MLTTNIKKLIDRPEDIKIIYLQGVLMPNGEIMCNGKAVGYYTECDDYVYVETD